MSLSNDLVSRFAKITKDDNDNHESTVYGTVVSRNDKLYVNIDGSDSITPIVTAAEIKAGERVTVLIKDHTATVLGNITNPSASTESVGKVLDEYDAIIAKIGNFELVIADKVSTEYLESKIAAINELIAGKATIGELDAVKATIKDLDVSKLQADIANINTAIIGKAEIEDLDAANANIETLKANVATINTLIGGHLTMDNIQSLVLTSSKVTVDNAFIKDAMIDRVSASKLAAGTINTSLINIGSADGAMTITGSLQQFRDAAGNVRIQIGKDSSGDFTFALYGADGKGQLINQNGITSSAISDGLIVNSMVSDNANISGSKLDISSVVTEINNGTETIKSSKIFLDEKNQTFDVAFNKLSTTVDNIEVGGRNYIHQGRGNKQEGFFDDPNWTITEDYAEATLTSQQTYETIWLTKGFVKGIREYEVGDVYTWSYDIMYTNWNVPDESKIGEWWLGQRYADGTSESSTGAWRPVTQHDLPKMLSGNMELNQWIHVEYTITIPEQAHSSISYVNLVQLYYDDPDTAATITFRIKNVKLEKGNKATDWTPAPEDTDSAINTMNEKINSQTTQLSVAQGKIETLVSNTTITKENGETVSLKDDYSTFKQTVDGISSKVGSLETNYSKTLKSTKTMYYVSTSATSLSGGNWSESTPTWTSGKYIWQKLVYVYSDGTTSDGTAVCIQGAKGETGATGAKGDKGDTGAKGDKGDTGIGIQSITEYYLATSANSGVTTSTSGWSTTIPTMTSTNRYLWNYEIVKYTNNTTDTKSPKIIGVYGNTGNTGSTGVGIKSVTNYYLATSANSGVTTSTSGWSTTVQNVTSTNKYLWNYEKVTFTDNTTATTTPCIIGAYGDKGDTGATGATGPKGDKGDTGATGAAGQSVISVTPQFQKHTSNTTAPTGTWLDTCPNYESGKYLWIRNKVVFANPTATKYTDAYYDPSWDAKYTADDTKKTVTSQISKFEQTLSGFTTRVESVESTTQTTAQKVDNIQVGGRNLVRTSNVRLYNASGNYDSATNTWTLTVAAGGDKWGSGLEIYGKDVIIPYGKAYILSWEMKVPRACWWNIDINNHVVSGTDWSGNDNDEGSMRKMSDRQITDQQVGQWIKCWVLWYNTSLGNTNKLDLYDVSHFGVIMENETESMDYYIRNVKGEIGTIPTEWTPAPEDVKKDIDDASKMTLDDGSQVYVKTKLAETITNLDGITDRVSRTESKINTMSIGGRNFLYETGVPTRYTDINTPSAFVTIDPYGTYNLVKLNELGFKVGDSITVSFDWEISNVTTAGSFRVETVSDNVYKTHISGPHDFGSATSGHYVATKILNENDVVLNKIRIRIDNSVLDIRIKNMKLEKGNVATDWSPAPEDVNSKLGSKNLLLGTHKSVTVTGRNISNQTAFLYDFASKEHGRGISNKVITISFDYTVSSGATGTFSLQGNGKYDTNLGETSGVWPTFTERYSVSDVTGVVHKTYTTSISVSSDKGFDGLDVRMDNFVGDLTISNVQIEYGDTATDWTCGLMIEELSHSESILERKADNILLQVQSKVDGNSIISAINLSPESIQIDSSKINITGFVTFSDLSTSGSTTINGDNITTGYISGSRIKGGIITATNEINFLGGARIFGNTGQYDAGLTISAAGFSLSGGSNNYLSGNWKVVDDGNFEVSNGDVTVGGDITANIINANSAFYGNGNIALNNSYIYTPYGYGYRDYVRLGGNLIVSDSDGSGYLLILSTAGDYASFRANSGSFYSDIGCTDLYASNRVYANGVALSSDKSLKTDIRYVGLDVQGIGDNGLVAPNVNITTKDMHNFIETLPMVSYRMKRDVSNDVDYTYYGFIAQDILYTKVGSELIEEGTMDETETILDEEGKVIDTVTTTRDILKYSENKFTAFICGALQEEIKQRKALERKLNDLIDAINK